MKKITCILIFLIAVTAFAQREASNWYFGNRAGIRFLPDGTVVPLDGSLMSTNEGCSSISDNQGNLLFYTDGRNVWDRNHLKMPNANYNLGTGLMGDPSSTQSGIIVPKKGDPNIYYIFTVDEPHHDNAAVHPNQFNGIYSDANGGFVPQDDDGFNNGLNYSVIDLSIVGSNGSIGDATIRNTHLVTYNPAILSELKYKCSEKITAVKNSNGTGYWVITQFIDKFYAFKVDASGVDPTPVVTQVSPIIPVSGYRRNSIGYLKASPDGTKLAIAHMQAGTVEGEEATNGMVYLYDFNTATGVVSNPISITAGGAPYGVEFSREAKKLYVSGSSLRQYNLLAPNIPQSAINISNGGQSAALQLGPDGKIYRAASGSPFLDVINNPEADGFLCSFQPQAQTTGGPALRSSALGLPPFITSLFSANILVTSNCLGQATQFNLNVTGTIDSVTWNFGDGSPTSSDTNPTHTYTSAGIYNVVADIVKNGETSQVSSDITVTAVPVANASADLIECDPDNNNVASFNLADATASVLGSQSSTQFDVKYFLTQENADNNIQPVTGNSFTNVFNPQTIFARVQNKSNPNCYATTSFRLQVTNTPVIASTAFAICDDAADGNDTNGQATFNLAAVTQAVVQNTAQFTTTYYPTFAKALSETDPLPANFYNTTPNQEIIYARIENIAFPACFRVEPVTLTVNPLPPVVANAALVQCDLAISPDGITQFNLSEANAQLTGGLAGLAVTYYTTAANAQNNTNALPATFTNTSNPQQIVARVSTPAGCFRIVPVTLTVNTNATVPVTLEQCDDDGTEDGLAAFNLDDAGIQSGTNTVVYYANADDALLEQNPIASAYTNTIAGLQSVYGRIESNNTCTALQEIRLVVRPLPVIDTTGEGIVCLNTGDFITLDAGLSTSTAGYAFVWSTGATTPAISVNQPGIYTVRVINTTNISLCERTRTITVSASDVATITGIDIVDLSENNTVTVHVVPTNNVNTTYLYSLDLPDGPFGPSNHFSGVSAGIHTVYVYDTLGCGVISKEIAVLAIPKFFTPNGDGTNDTWNIIGVNALFYQNSKIYIFDRFGKLLADVDPRSTGWDGLHEGLRLPATDYWYVVTLDNGRTVKGHFSLIR